MSVTSISVMYLVAMISASLLLTVFNRGAASAIRHRDTGAKFAFGVAGEHGAGVVLQDSKQMFGTVMWLAIFIGVAVGSGLPQFWAVSRNSPIEMGCQVIGGIVGGVIGYQLFTAGKRVLSALIIAAVVVVPSVMVLQWLSPAFFQGIQGKAHAWRSAQQSATQLPEINSKSRSTAATLQRFAGTWKGDSVGQLVEITNQGAIVYHYLKGEARTMKKRAFYGNGDIILMPASEKNPAMVFRLISQGLIERLELDSVGDSFHVAAELLRVDRVAAIKELDAMKADWRASPASKEERAKSEAMQKRFNLPPSAPGADDD